MTDIELGYSSSEVKIQPFILPADITALRRTDFPYCVHEALRKLEVLVRNGLPKPREGQLDVHCLVDEFIIFDPLKIGHNRKPLSGIQMLQLLEVLSDFFLLPNTDGAKNMMFMTLFHPGGDEQRVCRRVDVICRLVSLAVSTKHRPILLCTGVWMQQLGFTSPAVLRLASELIGQHLLTSHGGSANHLPLLAPHLAANLLTAAAHLYNSGPPPEKLVKQMLQWLEAMPSLPLIPLTTNVQALLPRCSLVMPSVTPMAGLFRWTVLQPVAHDERQRKRPRIKEESEVTGGGGGQGVEGGTHQRRDVDADADNEGLDKLMTRLHLRLLMSALEVPRLRPRMHTASQFITAPQLNEIVADLMLLDLDHSRRGSLSDRQQLSLDRLAQMFQVVTSVDGFFGNKVDSLCQLEKLHRTDLIDIVLQHHR